MPPQLLRRGIVVFAALVAPAHGDAAAATPAVTPADPAAQCGVGRWYDIRAAGCVTCGVESWCPADAHCAPGHEGHACGECAPHYFYAEDRCNECPSVQRTAVAWVCGIVACVVLGVITYHYASMDLTTLTIVMTHFQLSSTYFSFGFTFPESVYFFSEISHAFFGFGFLMEQVHGVASPSCLGFSKIPYSVYWIFNQALPFAFMLPFAVLFWLAESKRAACHASDCAKAPEHRILSVGEYEERKAARLTSKRAVQSILFIAISTLMNGVSSSVNVWFCPVFADGQLRLAEDPTVTCGLESPIYRSMLVASMITFAVYYFGIMGSLAAIIENQAGRRACAEHYVTHARLLRDANFMHQIAFSFNLFVYGPLWGSKMERARLFRKLKGMVEVHIAVRRLQAMEYQDDSQRSAFMADLVNVRRVWDQYTRNHREPPKKDPSYFLEAFPVFVPDPHTGAWVRGIFHHVDDRGLPRVAVGEGEGLTLRSYEYACMDFEDGRPVAITNRLSSWHHQEDNPLNAMSGAPLGEFGRIALDKKEARRDVMSSLPRVDIQLSMMAHFTFHLNLTEPLGFKVRKRLGRVYACDLDPLGQGSIAGMSTMCTVSRIGGRTVHTPEEFQVEIYKRRLVSAHLRRKALLDEEGATSTVIPLSPEDEALLETDVAAFFSSVELAELTAELSETESGLFVHCTCTYMDLNLNTVRNLPNDFAAFHQLAEYKREDPYWDTFGFILCVFKSSSRHFEQWASIRKLTAIFVQAGLATVGHRSLQGVTMLCVCVVALSLQVRLRPYDDRNTMDDMNNADAVISNNDLETCFLSLQIIQLCVGLLTLFFDMPGALTSFLYIAIVVVALGLSFAALSTYFARVVYHIVHLIEPYVNRFQGVFVSVEAVEKSSKREKNNRRRSALHQMGLLHLANKYEKVKIQKFEAKQEEAIKAKCSTKTTEGAVSAERALMHHRSAIAEVKEALTREKASWAARRAAAAKDGVHLVTVADKLGHLAHTSIGARARISATRRASVARAEGTKDFQLHKEKDAWEARRAAAASGGHMTTKTDSLGHFNAPTAAASMRRKSLSTEHLDVTAGLGTFEEEKGAWMARQADGVHHTVADQIGHFGASTAAADHHLRESIVIRNKKETEAIRAEASIHAYADRIRDRGASTTFDDIGHVGMETKTQLRNKAALEAKKQQAIDDAKRKEEEEMAWEAKLGGRQRKGQLGRQSTKDAKAAKASPALKTMESGVSARSSSIDRVPAAAHALAPQSERARVHSVDSVTSAAGKPANVSAKKASTRARVQVPHAKGALPGGGEKRSAGAPPQRGRNSSESATATLTDPILLDRRLVSSRSSEAATATLTDPILLDRRLTSSVSRSRSSDLDPPTHVKDALLPGSGASSVEMSRSMSPLKPTATPSQKNPIDGVVGGDGGAEIV